MERLESRYPDLEVTMVGDGENDSSGRVVIATIQTLARWRWEETYALGKQFGLVILDEAHHAPARTFTDVLCAMPARYRIGLTATPERDDGLTDMLWWNFGKEIFAISHSKLEKAGHIVTPQVVWLDSMWEPEDTELPWASIMSGLVSCELRNKALFDITANAVGQGRTVLFLSERVAHCTSMAEWFNDNGIEAAALVGSLSQKKRTDLLKDARDGRFKVVTATVLADEGLDLPNFDTLVLATPTRALGRVQQRIGRIMRPLDGKQDPLVYDMRDAWGPLRGQARKRESFYRKLLQ
jgi:superfamily II DNA or RNA helicase